MSEQQRGQLTLDWRDLEGSSEYHKARAEAFEEGRRATSRPTTSVIPTPTTMQARSGWIIESTENLLSAWFRDHRETIRSVGAYRGTETPVASGETLRGVELERARRADARAIRAAAEYRTRYQDLRVSWAVLDSELRSTAYTHGRLMGVMLSEYARGWRYRRWVDRIEVPAFDPMSLVRGRSLGLGVLVREVLGEPGSGIGVVEEQTGVEVPAARIRTRGELG